MPQKPRAPGIRRPRWTRTPVPRSRPPRVASRAPARTPWSPARRRRARGLGSGWLACVLLDERQHLPPGVRRGVLVLLEGAVEERVRRALVDHHLVGNAGLRQLAVELGEVLRCRRLVVAGEEQEEGGAHLVNDIADTGRDRVKSAGAAKSGLGCGLPP